jgi:cyclopropane fatty-acyl-phospholipid synthase-like methyltransferase
VLDTTHRARTADDHRGSLVPDVYATIADADEEVQARIASILELRAADPQQRAMVDSYLSRVQLGSSARVLEIGCGTGAVTRVLARRPGVAEAVGVEPTPASSSASWPASA